MTFQRRVYRSADSAKTFGPSNTKVVNSRIRLSGRLAARIAALAVLVPAGILTSLPLSAYPPPKPPAGPSPQQIQKQIQEQQRREQQMLQEWLKQQQLRHQHMQKMLEEHQKQLQRIKVEGTKANLPHPGAKPKMPHHAPHAHIPAITPKQFPNRKRACNELVLAMRHVNAAGGFPVEPREVALGNIREALLGLGETPSPLAPPIQRGNHIHWAEEHLQSAHNDVFAARLLPHEVKVAVLAEIHRAMFVLHHPGMPFPKMEQPRKELVLALHQVHAAGGLPPRRKDEVLTNISQALLVLGEVPPTPHAPSLRDDHVRLAEGHLRRAYKEVFETRHLPAHLRAPALWDIRNAMFVLTHPETPFPNMKPTRDELVRAWHQVHASSVMAAAVRELALTSIGEAIIVLGEKLPRARDRVPEGDHIKRAEEHLENARKDVISKNHLPEELKETVLGEIQRAAVALKHPAIPLNGAVAK